MHVVNLVSGYTHGYQREHWHQQWAVAVAVDEGKIEKVTSIVTPGGEFKQGMKIIKSGQGIVNCQFLWGFSTEKAKVG